MMKSGKVFPGFYLCHCVFQICSDIQWIPVASVCSHWLVFKFFGDWLSSVAILSGEMIPYDPIIIPWTSPPLICPIWILTNQESPVAAINPSLKTARLASTLTVSSVIYGETTWLITSRLKQSCWIHGKCIVDCRGFLHLFKIHLMILSS